MLMFNLTYTLLSVNGAVVPFYNRGKTIVFGPSYRFFFRMNFLVK